MYEERARENVNFAIFFAKKSVYFSIEIWDNGGVATKEKGVTGKTLRE